MSKISKRVLLTILSGWLIHSTFGQQVMMQGWYWDYPKTADGFSWADTLRLKAASLRDAGITHMWFPPHFGTSSGKYSNGYDPKDLYIGNATTGLGTRSALNAMLKEFSDRGISPVGDMIYNHRDGGMPEANPAVKEYITKLYNVPMNAYPSDRYRLALPLGGRSGNGAGSYYFKVSSKSGDTAWYNNKPYRVLAWTNKTGYGAAATEKEIEPNGGGDCGEPSQVLTLNKVIEARIENKIRCRTDEFKLTLAPGDFLSTDTLYITLTNPNGNYGDQRVYGLWSGPLGKDIVDQLVYQTYTRFADLPSGRGNMNYDNFKPNNGNPHGGGLKGEQDWMLFFYDYDQRNPATRDSLIAWTKWNWKELGVRGLRMDAIKHFPASFVSELLNEMVSAGQKPDMIVGEWMGDDPTGQKQWVQDVNNGLTAAAAGAVKPRVFDFTLRENLRRASDEVGFDVRNIFQGSLRDAPGINMSGYNVVTFLNNHDFRKMGGWESLIRKNPLLGYAYILTNNQLGVPCLYYPDYYGCPDSLAGKYTYHPVGLKPLKKQIDDLLFVHKTYVANSPSIDYLNRFGTPYSSKFLSGGSGKALIYQLQGSAFNGNREVIVTINYGDDTLKVDHQINNRGGTIASGQKFTDLLGLSAFPYAVVNASGQIYMQVPPKSYSVWIQGTLPKVAPPTHFREAAKEATSAEVNQLRLQISPNPAQGIIRAHITCPENRLAQIRLVSPEGKELRRFPYTLTKGTTVVSLDASTLPAGVYQFCVTDDSSQTTARVLVR